jgi:hypothetical protein
MWPFRQRKSYPTLKKFSELAEICYGYNLLRFGMEAKGHGFDYFYFRGYYEDDGELHVVTKSFNTENCCVPNKVDEGLWGEN